MLWFLRDYPLAAVLLRATTLAFDALLIGGLFFCAVLLPRQLLAATGGGRFTVRARRLLQAAAIGLALAQICFVVLDSAMLIGTGDLHVADLYTSSYFLAGSLVVLTIAIFLCSSRRNLPHGPAWLLFVAPLLFATVWTSHSASRLEHRLPLMALTGLHQLAAALWIGGMPYLWLLLESQTTPADAEENAARAVVLAVRRYSTTALASVLMLILAGCCLGWFYTQSWSAVYGTPYGVVLLAKSAMLVLLILFGGSNFLLIRKGLLHVPLALLRIVRLSEVEIGIGFTVILAAASLTSQPPAVDLVRNRVTLPEIAARATPHWPQFSTPSIDALPAVQPIGQAIQQYALFPDDAASANDSVERAWSEYNHHWAGIVVLFAGLLAILGRSDRLRWARHWPLAFLGLALFLFLRADPEAWPLGARGFWESLYNPEDLQHRLYILLIVCFAAFEWGVQTGHLASGKAALVFPAVCAVGGALLLTHNHTLGNIKEELLTEISHTAIAICAIFAGWSRWLEVRAPEHNPEHDYGRVRRIAAHAWPSCLILIGLVLLNYREA